MMIKTSVTPVTPASASRLEAIRGVALRLFVDEGYQAVSLRHLAEQAGLQAGSLYHYIDSKQSLLFDFIEEHEYRLLHCVSKPPLARVDPRDALAHYLGAYLRFALPRREWHLLSRRESYCLEPAQQVKIEALRTEQAHILRRIIASGIARRRLRADNLDIAVAAVRAMLDGAVLEPLGDDLRTEALIRGLQQMVIRSLAGVDAV